MRRSGEVLASGRAAEPVQPRPPELAADSPVLDHPAVSLDAALALFRPPLRALQRLAAGPAPLLAAAGLVLLVVAAPRRALLLALVPAYVLLQSPMHFEPRFALPKDAFTPALVAVGLVGLAGAVARGARRYWM